MTVRKQGRIRITYQLLRELLGLPEEVVITDMGADMTRQIMDVVYIPTTEEYISGGRVFLVGEGMEIPISNTLDTHDLNEIHYKIYERVRDRLLGAEVGKGDDALEKDKSCSCGTDATCLYHYENEGEKV